MAVHSSKTWLVENDGKVSLNGEPRPGIRKAELIKQRSDFARIGLGLLAIERNVGNVKGRPKPNESIECIGQQQIFYHFADTYKNGFKKALKLESATALANWFRTCNSKDKPNRAGHQVDELVGDFLCSSRSFSLQDFTGGEPEFLKFIETAQATQALIVKLKKKFCVVMPHEKAKVLIRNIGSFTVQSGLFLQINFKSTINIQIWLG